MSRPTKRPSLLYLLLNIVLKSKGDNPFVQSDSYTVLSPHPSVDDRDAWSTYWKTQRQPWRTEPEIDSERQAELAQYRTMVPDFEQGIFPFKDVKLNRADVEWLLATHEHGRGPVDWKDESQRDRKGLDLRGADLRQVDLSGLPLARLCGGISKDDWLEFFEQRTMYPVMYSVPQYATSKQQRITIAMLIAQADLIGIHLEEANLTGAHLEGAHFCDAHLERAYLIETSLDSAELAFAHLNEADLTWASLVGTELTGAHLEGADLNCATLAISSSKQGIGPQMVDAHWGEVNLAVVDWSFVKKLGEEHEAKQKKTPQGKVKSKALRLGEYQTAVRANRQLTIALFNQGLNEEAVRFAYRAQILQRKVLWKQRNFGRWLFSLLLALLAGYGYRMWRILAAYLFIVSLCAVAYFVIGIYHTPHLSLLQAFLESITAFHGRVFYELFTPDTPQIWVTAFEAIAGLIIESVFIAMLTQRFFGK